MATNLQNIVIQDFNERIDDQQRVYFGVQLKALAIICQTLNKPFLYLCDLILSQVRLKFLKLSLFVLLGFCDSADYSISKESTIKFSSRQIKDSPSKFFSTLGCLRLSLRSSTDLISCLLYLLRDADCVR